MDNLKHEAYPEVRKTAIHLKSARGRSQKGANVHKPHVKMSISQHEFTFSQFGPMDFYCNFKYVPHA